MGTPTRRAARTGECSRDVGRDAVGRADRPTRVDARPAEAPGFAAQPEVLRERTTTTVEPRDAAADPVLRRGARRTASAARFAGHGSEVIESAGSTLEIEDRRVQRPALEVSSAIALTPVQQAAVDA